MQLPDAKLDLLEVGAKYKFNEKGEYSVVYYAKDSANNLSTYQWKIVVE